jgi:putative PIN family toxin of toxin-antitoxin system
MKHANGGERLRVVVDTNVYISIFLYPERPIFHILRQAGKRRYQLLTSPAILGELGRVMREDFGVAERERIRRLKQIARIADIITPKITLDVITEDPPDNRILECAVEGGADLIVSGDGHLQDLKAYENIPIVRPVDFLRTLGAPPKRSP